MQRNRPFAVEIECGHPRGYLWVQTELAKRGLDFPTNPDGSGVEVKCGPLHGPSGFRTLRKTFQVLNELGCTVDRRDGMHVHFDATEFMHNHDMLKRVVRSWLSNQDNFHKLVASRRSTSHACAKWTETHVEQYEQGFIPNAYATNGREVINIHSFGPRGDLNLRSLHRHGTIEIRLHEGSLDADVAEAWVKLGLSFLNSVSRRKEPLPRCTIGELFQVTRTPAKAGKQLLMKVPAAELVELVA